MTDDKKDEKKTTTTKEKPEEKTAKPVEAESEAENSSKDSSKEEAKADEKDSSETPAPSSPSSPSPEPEKEELPGELQTIVDAVSKLNVLQVSQLVKALEDKFGVTAAAPVAIAATPNGGNGGESAGAEEKDSYKVVLKSDGGSKIPVIKALRELKPDLGLKEAKELVDTVPSAIEEDVEKERAEEIKKKLEEAGAEISLE